MKKVLGYLFLFSWLTSCVGVQEIDDADFSIRDFSISTSAISVKIGDTIEVNTEYTNEYSKRFSGVDPDEWLVSDESLLMPIGNRKFKGLDYGMVEISAKYDELVSNSVEIEVGDTTRMITPPPVDDEPRNGTFQGVSNYGVYGACELKLDDSGELVLILDEDFGVSNSGVSLVLYLSNFDNGVQGGTELVVVNSDVLDNLPYTVKISDYAPGVAIDSYNYVIVHCQPFNIPFGFAKLN